MSIKPRLNLLAIAVSAIVAASGAAVVVQGIQAGVTGLRGLRLVAFLLGTVICATGVFLFRRELRRRARLTAIAKLLPRYRARRRAWSSAMVGDGEVDPFMFNEGDWYDEPSERLAMPGAKVRAATRALLVSLEDELGLGMHSGERRGGRPACRRARLRAAGRSEQRRRRVPGRSVAIPS